MNILYNFFLIDKLGNNGRLTRFSNPSSYVLRRFNVWVVSEKKNLKAATSNVLVLRESFHGKKQNKTPSRRRHELESFFCFLINTKYFWSISLWRNRLCNLGKKINVGWEIANKLCKSLFGGFVLFAFIRATIYRKMNIKVIKAYDCKLGF